HYRIFLEQRQRDIIANNWPVPLTSGRINTVKKETEALFNGEPFTDTNGNGVYDMGEPYTDINGNGVRDGSIISQMLAPEVIAGRKMDLNRPFGDGRDNNNNGIVDEPAEAGEPYLDLNGNGQWDTGEPFIDVDGNGTYTLPSDRLWPEPYTDS